MSEYDISRAFKRIENDLMDSMMRNLKRHQAEETDLGIEWEQWQALQLKELERYRKQNADKFTDDFDQINRKVDAMFRATCNDAQSKQENYLLNQIKKGDFTPTQVKDTQFFNLNDAKLNILIERTKADFTRAEYAMLRKADDAYRKVIFDAQVYANVTNDYAKAVDMATHDFLMKGIQCVQYSNGAKHTLENYAEMCVRTGNKRAYLMGEGNAHDKYGIHTVRVNKRTQACPKCVKFLGRVLIDDVYSGGTAKEASDLGVPTLSSAIQAGFLHPNCKDIYSLYIDGVSKPATPWTQSEINDIVGDYNQEQELKHANDMVESYARLAKYALDPENQKTYRARAQAWDKRAIEIENGTTPVPAQPQVFTDDEKEALEWYVSGDGMWINQYLRDPSAFGELNDTENQLLGLLESATEKELEPIDTLYRSVDAKVIFGDLDETEIEQMMQHLLYGDSAYDKGAYSQNIKKRMEKALNDVKGKLMTEKGFMSTTVDKKIAEEFGDFTGAEHPVVIELDTKGKKIKGADVDFLDIEEDPQRERILAKNTRYKINDIVVETDADGARYIKVKAELVDQGAEVAEEVAEEVVEVAPKPFTPAKTKDEAEAFAKKFADTVNYKGVSLANANVINEQLSVLTEKYPIRQLESVDTVGKGVMSANYRNLSVNGKKLGKTLNDEKLNFELNRAMTESNIRIMEERWAGKKMPFKIQSDVDKLKERLKFSRWGVHSSYEDHVKCVVTHEYGHILSDQYFGMINHERANPNYQWQNKLWSMNERWSGALKKARENGDIYKISEYANTKPSEFFAECFVAREMGETLPDYVEELMKEVLENGIM